MHATSLSHAPTARRRRRATPSGARAALSASAALSRRALVRRLGMVAVAGMLLVGGAVPAQAWSPDSPKGNLDGAVAVTGGVRVRGWAWDPSSSQSVTVSLTVGATTTRVTASTSRPDVADVYPAAGSTRGFETVVRVPAGTHRVCATAIDIGAGSDTTFPCRTVTVTSGTPTTSRALTWAPPALTNPTTVTVSATNRDLRLEAGRDYVVRMPSQPLDAVGGLIIGGGRNVVLVGGEIRISRTSTATNGMRGLYLKGQSGTVHVEGLKITGGALAEGINLDQRNGATVQLQNVRVDTVHGSHTGHHADVIQTWAGPKVLRIDGLTGHTTYQGFFLMPTQYGSAPSVYDVRNVNLVGRSGSKYLLWRDNLSWPLTLRNVWAAPYEAGVPRHQFLRETTNPGTWSAVQVGVPAGGDIVPAGLAGTAYVSPGYR